MRVLHPFEEQFTSQSGANLLQYLTFEQKKTKIAQVIIECFRLSFKVLYFAIATFKKIKIMLS